MSLGSRIASRGKGTVVASLSSTPRDPLLFLYPQWARNSSFGLSKPSLPFGRASPRIPGRSQAPAVSRRYNPTYANSKLQKTSNQTLDEATQNPGTPSYHEPIAPETHRLLQAPQSSSREFLTPGRKLSNKHAQLPIEQKVRKILSQNHQAQGREDYNRRARLAYQAHKVEQRRSWLPDWRVIVADLVKHTPKNDKWLQKALSVMIPPDSTEQLLSGIDNNLWDIALRYGCSVELDVLDDYTSELRRFVISGSASAISKTAADVLRISPQAEMTVMSRELTGQNTVSLTTTGLEPGQEDRDGSVRRTISERRHRPPVVRADKIPVPEDWTTLSFADYVKALTSSELSSHIHRLVYSEGQEHKMSIAEILQGLFIDPNCRSSISRTAFNTAMAYYVKMNLITDAKVLFVHMETMKLEMDTESFNIMLRGAAKAEDLHNFHFILNLMLRRGLLPNARTWIAFMMAIPDLRIKVYIMSAMKQKGLLFHLSTIKAIAEQLSTYEIEESLDRNDSQEQFLQHMDSRYGPKWLSTASGNRILNALGARGLISRCWQFLHVMEDRFINLNQIAINTILNHCRLADNGYGAIELMKNLPRSFRFVPDELTYHLLFDLAWRLKNFNLAKVVWRYACLSGATSYRMRTRFSTSLKISTWKANSGTRRQLWKHNAGRFIAGRDMETRLAAKLTKKSNNTAAKADGSQQETNAGQSSIFGLSTSRGTGVAGSLKLSTVRARRTHFKRIQELVHSDYTAFQTYKPSVPLEDMLLEAFERDKEWHSHFVVRKKMSIDWLLQRGIEIEVDYKDPAKRRCGQRIYWT